MEEAEIEAEIDGADGDENGEDTRGAEADEAADWRGGSSSGGEMSLEYIRRDRQGHAG
jgi:hypothetical protein